MLPFPSCVTLDKYLTSLILCFLFCKGDTVINPQTQPKD